MSRYPESDWNIDARLQDNSVQPAGNGLSALPAGQAGWVEPPAKGISYGQLASQHKLFLLSFLLLGALAGTAYVTLRTPLYDAVTTVEMVGLNQSFMGMSQVDPQAGTDSTTASASNIQTQTKILTSRTLLGRVLNTMDLESAPVVFAPTTFFTRLHTKLFNRLSYGQNQPLEQTREAIRAAAGSVSAKGVGTSRLIEIQCRSTSPQVAADFVNTLTREHLSHTLAARATVTEKTSQWMDSQLGEAKIRLQQAGEKLRDFVRKSGMDFFPEQSTLADSKLRQLQADVSGIQADRIAKQARWELAKNTPPQDLPDVLNDSGLLAIRNKLAELRDQLAPLTVTLTPQNIRVQRIQAQIDLTEQNLRKEETALPVRLEADYREALRKEKLLMGAYSTQTHSVSGQADQAAQYSMLKRDVEIEQQLYNSLLQESNQAALMALVPSSNIRVVDAAIPSDVPSSPKPVRDIPSAAVLGGAIGFGLVVLRENTRRKKLTSLVVGPGHTQMFLGVPELGVIPSAQLNGSKHKWGSARVLDQRSPAQPLGISLANGNGPSSEFTPWQKGKSSLLAESFRQTLVSLLATQPTDHSPVYVISSAGPSEGKTTLSMNLASAMADIGHRVLLVDADLRRSHRNHPFGEENRAGLSDILASDAPIEGFAIGGYIQPTSNPNLQLMTHGLAEVETPPLLFFSPRTEKLIALLRRRFDCIFLDTAPSLPFPDARLLGKHADGVVLVVRAGVTNREGAAAVCQRFQDDGTAVLGTILNDWTPKHSSVSGYYSDWYKAFGAKQ